MQANSNQHLSKSVASLEKTNELDPRVAISDTVKDFDNKKVSFSFEIYNNNQCEISKLDNKEAKKLTKKLKKISETRTKHFKHQDTSGIDCKPIHCSGSYEVLFDGIPEDIDMLEIDYSKAGRIFGYIVENIFNIVAIAKKHK